jgi:hypothetical protein
VGESDSVAPLFSLSPRDSQQQGALFQRFNVVEHAAVQNQQLTDRHIHSSIRQMDTDLPLQQLNGDPSLCSVLAHSCAALHQNQNDSQIRIFRECFGALPRFPLPGVCLSELLQLSFHVDLY